MKTCIENEVTRIGSLQTKQITCALCMFICIFNINILRIRLIPSDNPASGEIINAPAAILAVSFQYTSILEINSIYCILFVN